MTREEKIVQMAKDEYEIEGDIEVDAGATISEGDDNGAYVQAWVWVSFDGTEFDKHPDAGDTQLPESISDDGSIAH